MSPGDYKAYYDMAMVKKAIRDFKGAIDDYSKVIDLVPRHSLAFFNRGLAKISAGEKEEGCKDLNQAVEFGFEAAKIKLATLCGQTVFF